MSTKKPSETVTENIFRKFYSTDTAQYERNTRYETIQNGEMKTAGAKKTAKDPGNIGFRDLL